MFNLIKSIRGRHRGIVASSLLLALAISARAAWPAPAAARSVAIAGNSLTLPAGAHVLGPVPASRPMRLIIGLTPRHGAVLDAFARLRTHPGSPFYRHALSAAQFASLFGPTVADQDKIVAYLRGYGLRLTRTYADRLLLDVSGTARQIAAAFGVSLVSYRSSRGAVYYANATAPQLPAGLAGLVSTVIGLRDDVAPHHAPLPRLARAGGIRPRGEAAAPQAPPTGLLTPAQIRTAYDFTPVYSQVFTSSTGLSATAAITGAGETIALYELSPYDPADIAAYDAAFGISAAAPVNIPIDGGAVDGFQGQGTGEAALDIELLQAIAPGARLLVYNGPASPSSNDNTGADDTYARIVNDGLAQVLSTSWGQCEDMQQADQPPDFTLLHNLLAQAVAEGMTVVAASGDNGAYDCVTANNSVDTTKRTVDYPASDPYAIAVGGTTLTMNSAGAVASEGSWSGSGGGRSAYFAQPSWQTGPGVANALSNGKRQVPDVSLNAGAGYAVWVSGGWLPQTGTSAGPPVWSALLALANQARYVAAEMQGAPTPLPCAVLPGLGDIHAELYHLGGTSAFRDISSGPGNNFATPGPGWDYVTGWGTPDAYTLLRALIALPALTAPAPGPCPTATPLNQTTPTPSNGGTSPTALPAPTGTPLPARTAVPTKPPRLIARATPGRVRAGGEVTLQLSGGATNRRVTFELRYPGQRPRRLRSLTGLHGRATLRLHVLAALPKGDSSLVVWLRVTVQGEPLVGWASFRVLPALATQSHTGGHHAHKPPTAPPLCRPHAGVVGVRGGRPCGQ